MSRPIVTVALPIYNSAAYLQYTLDDISSQTFEDFEVIAVLDGCTDDSENILRRHSDSRIGVVKKAVNEGHVAALNTIHDLAQGEFLARFDSDDKYEPTRLALQVDCLRAYPDIDVLGTRFDYIDGNGNLKRVPREFPLGHARIRRDFQRYTVIGGPTCMYRLKKIRAVGDYDPRFNHVEDLALWLACLTAGYKFRNLPEVLVHYRVHDTQASQRNHERQLPQLAELYELYGPSIWGKNYRAYGGREPKLTRWTRKLSDALIPDL